MSTRDLRLRLVLDTIEKASAPLKKITGASTKTTQALKANRDQLQKLQAQQRKLTSFKKLQQATDTSAEKLDKARQRAKELAQQFHAAEKPSKTLTNRFKAATTAAAKLKNAHNANRDKLHQLNNELKTSGINTRYLERYQAKLSRAINNSNKSIELQKQKLAASNQLQRQQAKIRSAGGNVRTQAGRLARQGLIAGAAGGYFFKTQLLDTAAQFEDLQAVLEVVEGSSLKAAKAMNWVSDFAAKTPYQLAEVTDAYKQLRAYGLEPTNGLLKTLGDTSAAMNKPIMQAVEAVADAITGENERLKEFGIRASKAGGMISYEYTDRSGKQRSISAKDGNRAQIQQVLETIWNEKFAGAMDKRSRTWRGMVSNMSDQWTRFTNMMMAAGLFDWMKDTLGGLLEKVNKMAADGSLQALATEWGQNLKLFATGLWTAITTISSMVNSLADLVGGFDNLIYILAALKLAGFIGSLFTLGKEAFPLVMKWIPKIIKGLRLLTVFLMTNPIGLIVTAIAAAAALIYYNWDGISAFFSDLWVEVKAAFDEGLGGVLKLMLNWSPLGILYQAIKSALSQLGVDLPDRFTDFGAMLIDGMIDGITSRLKALQNSVLGAAESTSNWFKDALGIHSPSRVFAGHGKNVIDGVNQGLNSGNIRVDNRAPISMAGGSGGRGAVSIGEIHIHAAPGMDEQQLSDLVTRKIMELQSRNAAGNRSKLSDED